MSSDPTKQNAGYELVKPPRVKASPTHLECLYHTTMTLPANRRESVHRVVVGKVVGIHIRDDVLGDDGKIDVLAVRPLARLGYLDYAVADAVFQMRRPRTPDGSDV